MVPRQPGRVALHRAGQADVRHGLVESFNGSFRDECLNETLFSSLTRVRTEITAWKEDDNRNRPHSSLGHITPSEFALKIVPEKQAA
jgi:putative transposase